MTDANAGASFVSEISRIPQLEERLTNMGSRVSGLEQAMTLGFSEIKTAMQGLAAEFHSKQGTPWGVVFSGVGVGVTIIVALGATLYMPIKDKQMDIGAALAKTVTREELNFRSDRAAEDRIRADRTGDTIDRRLSRLEALLLERRGIPNGGRTE